MVCTTFLRNHLLGTAHGHVIVFISQLCIEWAKRNYRLFDNYVTILLNRIRLDLKEKKKVTEFNHNRVDNKMQKGRIGEFLKVSYEVDLGALCDCRTAIEYYST